MSAVQLPAWKSPHGPDRRVAAYLDPAAIGPLRYAIVVRALMDAVLCESPPGSNRGGRVDEYNTASGAPLGSPHCASTVSAWWRESGAATPGKFKEASCDEWMKWAKAHGTFHPRSSTYQPQPGDAVLYGVPGDARHIGVLVRVIPAAKGFTRTLIACEGNTTMGGFNREGFITTPKVVDLSRVLGWVEPKP